MVAWVEDGTTGKKKALGRHSVKQDSPFDHGSAVSILI